jgi:anti-sigma-K factor RskA
MADHPHDDLAAWLLGELEPEAERAFATHLRDCEECRSEAAELDPLPGLLATAAPPFTVPAGLEARTFEAIERAAGTRRRRRRWRVPIAVGAVTAAAAAAVAVGVVVLRDGGDRLTLESVAGEAVDVSATVQVTDVGREVTLDIDRLADPRPDGVYELWFVAPDDTRRRPDRISAGTFHPSADGTGRVRLVAAADPQRYPRLSVTLEPADGNPRRTGPEVLREGGQTP